jgi:hyperosmotically inducible protein
MMGTPVSRLLRPLLGAVLLVAVAGCATVTGKSATQSVDDALTTAAVKTRLAQERFSSLARIDVDTDQGLVTLSGVVDSEEARLRAVEAARHVGGVRGVVNNLQVRASATPSPAPVVVPPVTPGTGAVPPVAGPTTLDRENQWRAGAATLEGTLSDIRRRATREAALQNRTVAYESVDGFQRVEVYPLGILGPSGCQQVQERIFQDGRLAQERPTEVCR